MVERREERGIVSAGLDTSVPLRVEGKLRGLICCRRFSIV